MEEDVMSDENFDNYSPGYGPQTHSLAVVSLISGIASFFVVPLLGAIVAIITGNIAKKDIRQSNGQLIGQEMANWGVILGWINIGLSVVGACVALLAILGVFGVISIPLCFGPFGHMFQ
jgi:hypothetical protein